MTLCVWRMQAVQAIIIFRLGSDWSVLKGEILVRVLRSVLLVMSGIHFLVVNVIAIVEITRGTSLKNVMMVILLMMMVVAINVKLKIHTFAFILLLQTLILATETQISFQVDGWKTGACLRLSI